MRIAKFSIILSLIMSFEILALSNVADKQSSKWAGLYIRRLSRTTQTTRRADGPRLANGSEHIQVYIQRGKVPKLVVKGVFDFPI